MIIISFKEFYVLIIKCDNYFKEIIIEGSYFI